MEKEKISKITIGLILLLLAYISYLIVKPYLITILTSAVLAYLFFPIKKKLKIPSNTISALLVLLIIIVIAVLPLSLLTKSLIDESITVYNSRIIDTGVAQITEFVNNNQEVEEILTESTKTGLSYLASTLSKSVLSLPSTLLNILIGFYMIFYILASGEKIAKFIKKQTPIKNKEKILKHINDAIHSIVHGTLITAVIQFVIAAIGFKILGIQSPILWAFIIALLAFIPFAGSTLVWVPMLIIEIILGKYPEAIGVLIIGIIVSSIETFLRPKIIGSKAAIHPTIVLIGALGGITVFGIIGIIIGPIILSAFTIILQDYQR